MAERSQQPQAAVPPPPARKRAVQVGSVRMMLSVAMYGLVFATLTAPILESAGAMGYVSLSPSSASRTASARSPTPRAPSSSKTA